MSEARGWAVLDRVLDAGYDQLRTNPKGERPSVELDAEDWDALVELCHFPDQPHPPVGTVDDSFELAGIRIHKSEAGR